MKIIKLLPLSILLLSVNLFANAVATITAIKGSANIERKALSIDAILGSALEEKDRIVTKDNSKLQLIFKDETVITIGANSNFSIKEYLFEDNKEPVARFNMLQGAMRTISGKIGKIAPQNFSVRTKNATIGIRGTNFTIVAQESGSFQAYCTYGAISAKVENKTYIVQQGYYVSITPQGSVQIIEFTPEDLKEMKDKNFKSTMAKSNSLSRDAKTQENSEQLNLTVTDDSAIIIQDVTDTTADSILNNDGLTDSSVIAGYTLTNVVYDGTFSTTSSTFLPSTGTAKLTIDFGADTAALALGTDLAFITGHTNGTTTGLDTNTFSISEFSSSATGKFNGPTGNNVEGTFNYDDQSTQQASGTYTVDTTTALQ